MTAGDRWSQVVEFVRSNHVSDISVFQSNVTARLEGRVVHLSEEGALSPSEVQELIAELIKLYPAAGPEVSGSMGSADYTAEIDGVRFRVNLGRAQGELFESLRALPAQPPDLLEIGISKRIAALVVALTDGLVLISGPTGSGKTTTIAGIIEAINVSRPAKVGTIWDPVEFLFRANQAEIIQREVGRDVPSYAEGLRQALRQNPDVIVVGEIRDADSVLAALQAAETGHLVIGSLHASSVGATVRRLILLAPERMGAEVRFVFGRTIRLVMNQRLLRRKTSGRIAVREICVHAPNTEAVILSGNERELENYMLAGRELGMVVLKTRRKPGSTHLPPTAFCTYA